MDMPPLLARLDASQLEAATIDTTSVVTAGAGAGKTSTLAARCLHLMLERNIRPQELLALTFTRKAATEMFSRIFESLLEGGERFRDLALSIADSHIQTLDSFCREIVADAAAEYGYTRQFQIDEPRCRELASSIATRYVLEHRHEPGLKEYLEAFGLDKVMESLFASFGSELVAPHWKGTQRCRQWARVAQDTLLALAKQYIEKARTLATRIVKLGEEVQSPRDGSRAAIHASHTLLKIIETEGGNLEGYSSFMEAWNPSSLDMHKVGKNDQEQEIKTLVYQLFKKHGKGAEATHPVIDMLIQLHALDRFRDQYERIMDHLDAYADLLCEQKQAANVMDYKDLGLLAIDILERNRPLREYWKSKFQRILVDEFQDNNGLQKRLLALLSGHADGDPDPGKLFFVGDEKQSIYLFRGADVSVFKSLARELGAKPMVLSNNYRSTPQLIEFFNQAFNSIMQPMGTDYLP
ncbi:MAG: UvrD-helicase domain-containing protein, partial [Spirochaetales bacterium]|nr:UvrD-helicase domain-containing protein [Spirochaetales bacterium]